MGTNARLRGSLYLLAALTVAWGGAAATAAKPSGAATVRAADLNPTDLPICPPPGPQLTNLPPPLPLSDPSAPRCQVVPANVGLNLAGINGHRFLQVTAAVAAILARDSHGLKSVIQSRPAIRSPNLSSTGPCDTYGNGEVDCHEGIAMADASGIARRVQFAATLYAQSPTLYGNAEVYNWIGMQNNVSGGNLAQIGITYNNLSYLGSAFCTGNNDVNYRPIIDTQAEIAGPYTPITCFPGFVFGLGTQTFFEATWHVSGTENWWNLWVNWNNTWEALIGYHIQTMYPSNAFAAFVPAEVIEFGTQYVDPNLPSIPDQQAQIYDGNTWHWWTTSIDTFFDQQGTSYCLSFPTKYTNVTVSNC